MEGRPCEGTMRTWPTGSKGERPQKIPNLSHLDLGLRASRIVRKQISVPQPGSVFSVTTHYQAVVVCSGHGEQRASKLCLISSSWRKWLLNHDLWPWWFKWKGMICGQTQNWDYTKYVRSCFCIILSFTFLFYWYLYCRNESSTFGENNEVKEM